MRDMWQVKWWRVGVALLVCFAAMFAAGFVWEQWAGWQLTQEFLRENPNLVAVPVPLPDTRIAQLDGARVAILGLSVQVPWKEVLRQRDFGTMSFVGFKDGGVLMLTSPSITKAIDQRIQSLAKNRQEADAIRETIGSHVSNCCYDLMARELAATPSQVRWWNQWGNGRSNFVLLMRKSEEVMDSSTIYNMSGGEMRGFQFGNPAVAPYGVTLELFDRDDRRHEIRISRYDASSPFLTQAEVNAIVASIHPIPHS